MCDDYTTCDLKLCDDKMSANKKQNYKTIVSAALSVIFYAVTVLLFFSQRCNLNKVKESYVLSKYTWLEERKSYF